MSLEAMAIGTVHQKLDQMELGRLARFEGFLTHKSLRSQRLVFHITHIEL
jgi:primosomal replication protein N